MPGPRGRVLDVPIESFRVDPRVEGADGDAINLGRSDAVRDDGRLQRIVTYHSLDAGQRLGSKRVVDRVTPKSRRVAAPYGMHGSDVEDRCLVLQVALVVVDVHQGAVHLVVRRGRIGLVGILPAELVVAPVSGYPTFVDRDLGLCLLDLSCVRHRHGAVVEHQAEDHQKHQANAGEYANQSCLHIHLLGGLVV